MRWRRRWSRDLAGEVAEPRCGAARRVRGARLLINGTGHCPRRCAQRRVSGARSEPGTGRRRTVIIVNGGRVLSDLTPCAIRVSCSSRWLLTRRCGGRWTENGARRVLTLDLRLTGRLEARQPERTTSSNCVGVTDSPVLGLAARRSRRSRPFVLLRRALRHVYVTQRRHDVGRWSAPSPRHPRTQPSI